MKHVIEFEKKVGLGVIDFVPSKAIDNSIPYNEWNQFLTLLVKKGKLKVLYVWDDEQYRCSVQK